MKKIALITAAVLTSLGLAILMGVLLISNFDVSKLDKTEYETNIYRVSEDFEKIRINTREPDIVLLASEDNTCKVICVEQKKVKHSVSVENGTLQISETDTRKWYDHITMFAKPISVKVYLPSDQLEALNIDSGTGDVSVPAALTFGSVRMKASTGDITLSGVKAGQIDLSVSTGEILIRSVICRGTASVRVETGDTRITDMTCRNLLTTGSTGDITLKNTVVSDSLSVTRSTGDVNLDHCDAEQITVQTSTGDVSGTLLTEKIFIPRSSTGSIHVPDTAAGGKCQITTSTGDINIRLK